MNTSEKFVKLLDNLKKYLKGFDFNVDYDKWIIEIPAKIIVEPQITL